MTSDSYIEDNVPWIPKSSSTSPEIDDSEIPFHFRETPVHEAAYRLFLAKKKIPLPVAVNITNTEIPKIRVPNSTRITNGWGKQMAGIVALPMAIAATAMGIYNSVQIQFLKNELLEVKETI